MMDLIPINYENSQITVLGRDLHAALEIKSDYSTWFKRMAEYGFEEGTDYVKFLEDRPQNLEKDELGSSQEFSIKPKTNHQLTLDMAKEIAMIQRTPIGKQVRKYFIEVEKQYRQTENLLNKDTVTQALTIAADRADAAVKLGMEVSLARLHAMTQVEGELSVNLYSWKQLLPPSNSYDLPALTPTQIANILGDGMTARKVNLMLAEHGLQFKPVNTWLLTEAGKQYAVIIPFYNSSAEHYGYQIKWKISVLNVLK